MYSTLDLLYLVLAVGFLWIAIFLCAALYQFGGFFRRANKIIDKTVGRVEKVQEALKTLKGNMEHAATYVNWAAKGGEFIFDKFNEKKKKSKKSEE